MSPVFVGRLGAGRRRDVFAGWIVEDCFDRPALIDRSRPVARLLGRFGLVLAVISYPGAGAPFSQYILSFWGHVQYCTGHSPVDRHSVLTCFRIQPGHLSSFDQSTGHVRASLDVGADGERC